MAFNQPIDLNYVLFITNETMKHFTWVMLRVTIRLFIVNNHVPNLYVSLKNFNKLAKDYLVSVYMTNYEVSETYYVFNFMFNRSNHYEREKAKHDFRKIFQVNKRGIIERILVGDMLGKI